MAELLLGLAAASGYLGFALLALSLPRHRQDVAGEPGPPRRPAARRAAGSAALALVVVFTVGRDGPAFGSVLAVLMLGACAAAVALTLAWRPHWLKGLVGRAAENAQTLKRST